MATDEVPPPFEPTNVIDLVSVTDSKIIHVSLYTGRAEITRLYKLTVQTGQNEVNINGLPSVLDRDSLRVEGRGAATIHDVTLSDIPKSTVVSTSASLEGLLSEKELAEKGLQRCKKALASLEVYLSTLNVQHTDVTELDKVVEHYDRAAEKLDKRVLELEKRVKKLDEDIGKERAEIEGKPRGEKLSVRAAIGVFAPSAGEVEIALIYAVRGANWDAGYDIRVDMKSEDKPATLIYKAKIVQNTGESWDDVPLTLETATPTFGINIPSLWPWTLSVGVGPFARKSRTAPRLSNLESISVESSGQRMASLGRAALLGGPGGDDKMPHRELSVASEGAISATFRVPGSITIPSDGVAHNVTIVQLKLDASMSWVTVPKVDTKSHLKAKIKNASDYTLLRGAANVYVDGSFIARSDVPLVSPQESFDCPLGLDPSIRVTYHPQSKKVTQTGFYGKTSNHLFVQRITVYNTKSTPIDNFKVIDQLPVSQSSQITVKLSSPALTIPNHPNGEAAVAPPPVKVNDGVVAQWEGADEQDFDMAALGVDGKFYWLCSVPAQGKINLLLSWEVTAPLKISIPGL